MAVIERAMRPGGISVYSEECQYMKVLFGTPWGPEGWGISNYVAVDERSNTPYWISKQYDGQIAAQTWYLDKKELTFGTVTEYAQRISPTMYHAAKGIGPDNWREYIPGLKAAQEQLWEEKRAAEVSEMRKTAEAALADFPNAREILEQMDISAYGISAKTQDHYPRFQIRQDVMPSPRWELSLARRQTGPDSFGSDLKGAIRALAICIEITQCGDDPDGQRRKEALENRLAGIAELPNLRCELQLEATEQDAKHLVTLFDINLGPGDWYISNKVVIDERTGTPYWFSTQYDDLTSIQTRYLEKKQLTFDAVMEYARQLSPRMYDAAKGIGPGNWREYIPGLKAAQEKLREEKQAADAAEIRKTAEAALAGFPNARKILAQMDISACSISVKTPDGFPKLYMDTNSLPTPRWKLERDHRWISRFDFRKDLNSAIRALAVCIEITQCSDSLIGRHRKEVLEKRLVKMWQQSTGRRGTR